MGEDLDNALTPDQAQQARADYRETHGDEHFGPHVGQSQTYDRLITSADVPIATESDPSRGEVESSKHILDEYADFVSAVLHASLFTDQAEAGVANLAKGFLDKHPELAREKAEPIQRLREDLLQKLNQ